MSDLTNRRSATSRLSQLQPRHTPANLLLEPDDACLLEQYPPAWDQLIEALPDGSALLDRDGVIHYVNELLSTMTSFSREELVGQNVEMLVPPRLRSNGLTSRRDRNRVPASRVLWDSPDLAVLRKDGSELPVEFAVSPLRADGASWSLVAVHDNSAQYDADRDRADEELRFRVAFESNMAPMTFTDADDIVIAVNDAFCEMVGFSREELIGRDSTPFTYPEDVGITEETLARVTDGEVDHERYVKRYLRKDGRVIYVEVSRSPARDADGRIRYFVFSERDITEERALTLQLSHQALHDPLTGLANRVLFEDRLGHSLARVLRQGGVGAVLLLDLDDFKGVNDTHGHVVGDQLLTAIANRLQGATRECDTLCRFGGDEFLYLADGLESPGEAERLADRLLDALASPFAIADTSIEQHASVGIVVWDQTNSDATEIIQNVDAALHEAKRNARGRRVRFTPSMHERAVSRFALVQELRRALVHGDLKMHYQPIADLATSEVVGFEALMRWFHPDRGWVPPSVFIPLAEQSDLILDLGAFALREAVTEASTWVRKGPTMTRPYITVNLSAHQFLDPGLVPLIKGTLAETGLAPEHLILEITESVALMDIAETLNVLEHLNLLGVSIALDDFGTGFSSLSYLAALNPRIIKIDQSFIRPGHESVRNDLLLETIISLGQRLSVTMLAEGIETTGQISRLRRLGCERGQGFLFSPAVPHSEVEAMVGQVFHT